nr:hypothetical protein [Alicyclobacillus macrosporangiidus]
MLHHFRMKTGFGGNHNQIQSTGVHHLSPIIVRIRYAKIDGHVCSSSRTHTGNGNEIVLRVLFENWGMDGGTETGPNDANTYRHRKTPFLDCNITRYSI